MRFILTVIVGLFLVTYGWGWYVHVHGGSMGLARYTEYYGREVSDQFHHFLEKAGKVIEDIKKPLPAHKEFTL